MLVIKAIIVSAMTVALFNVVGVGYILYSMGHNIDGTILMIFGSIGFAIGIYGIMLVDSQAKKVALQLSRIKDSHAEETGEKEEIVV